jgi:tetratricopeptide (TPR) repeat protein
VIAGLSVALLGGCAASHQERAHDFYMQGRLDRADDEIEQAMSDDPDDPTIANQAAEIFTQEGLAKYKTDDYSGASTFFHRAIDYCPTYGPAYDYLGQIAFAKHDWKDAISYGNEAASYSSQPVPGYVELAKAQQRKVESENLFAGHGSDSSPHATAVGASVAR